MATPLPVLVCPACGAPGATPWGERADGELLQVCPRCHTIHRATRPVSIDALYRGPEAMEAGERAREAARWRLGWLLYATDVLGATPGPLLDAACGSGEFLALARAFELGPTEGWELAPRAARLHQEAGLLVPGLDFAEWRQPRSDAGPYGAIAAWDLLDLLPHPREAASHLVTLLAPEGVLVFAVPNMDAVHATLAQPQRWSGFRHRPERLAYFTEAGLEALLAPAFPARFYQTVTCWSEPLFLGVACRREPTLRQAELLAAALEAPGTVREALRVRELGPRGLLGLALLESAAGDAEIAEEAALHAELAGAASPVAAYARGLVALKRNRLEAARLDLSVASQAPRLREASQGLLVTVLERLLADAEALGEARRAAAIAAEAQRRRVEPAPDPEPAPPARRAPEPAALRPSEPAARPGPALTPASRPTGWTALLREGPRGWLAAARRAVSRAPAWHVAQRRARDRMLEALGDRPVLVVLPGAHPVGWLDRWAGLGRALAARQWVVFLVTDDGGEAEPEAFSELAPGLIRARSLALLTDLPSPTLVATRPAHLETAMRFIRPTVFYDAPGIPEEAPERVAHEALLRGAHAVVCRSAGLHALATMVRPDAGLLPDGGDPAAWAPEVGRATPTDLAPVLPPGRPVAGTLGLAATDLDLTLLEAVAHRLPAWTFVVVGAGQGAAPEGLPGNVHWLDPRPADQLPAYMQELTVALLPLTPAAASEGRGMPALLASLAADKPVVSVPFAEASVLRSVRTAEGAEALAAGLEAARTTLAQPAARAHRTRECEANTWALRAASLQATLEGAAGSGDVAVVVTRRPLAGQDGDHRAAQLARAFVGRGWQVVYVQPGPTEIPPELAHPRLSVLPLDDPHAVGHLALPASGRLIAVLTSPHPAFASVVEALEAARAELIYDLTEDVDPAAEASGLDPHLEARLAGLADVLTAPSLGIASVLEARCGRTVHVIPDGVDRTRFNRHGRHPRPADLPPGRPLLLYAGPLWDAFFDWGVLRRVLEAQPGATVVLLGDHTDQCPFPPPPGLHFLGSRPRRSWPAYLAAADVVIAPVTARPGRPAPRPPLVLAGLTMGRPVVATAYAERTSWPGLYVAPDAQTFLAAIGRALAHPLDGAIADALAKVNCWDARLDTILDVLGAPGEAPEEDEEAAGDSGLAQAEAPPPAAPVPAGPEGSPPTAATGPEPQPPETPVEAEPSTPALAGPTPEGLEAEAPDEASPATSPAEPGPGLLPEEAVVRLMAWPELGEAPLAPEVSAQAAEAQPPRPEPGADAPEPAPADPAPAARPDAPAPASPEVPAEAPLAEAPVAELEALVPATPSGTRLPADPAEDQPLSAGLGEAASEADPEATAEQMLRALLAGGPAADAPA
ncbi:MAG: methyltransferase domain-containing protein [Candidatus Sericytochromatia bacterium]|nr:methyltransferase domain-containing protein [Candidatus Sericytochromatia bacterium]